MSAVEPGTWVRMKDRNWGAIGRVLFNRDYEPLIQVFANGDPTG